MFASMFILTGTVVTAFIGNNLVKSQIEEKSLAFEGLSLHAPGVNSTIFSDIFGSMSLSVQHGNFQRFFLDLTRVYARMDFPSGTRFFSEATKLAQDIYNSRQLSTEAVRAICPKATLSLQQQVLTFSVIVSCVHLTLSIIIKVNQNVSSDREKVTVSVPYLVLVSFLVKT